MNNQPDGMLVLQVPIFTPTPEDISLVESQGAVEPFLHQLRETGYISNEELAAFIKFMNIFALYGPFVLDSFLEGYRNSKKPADKPKETDRLVRI